MAVLHHLASHFVVSPRASTDARSMWSAVAYRLRKPNLAGRFVILARILPMIRNMAGVPEQPARPFCIDRWVPCPAIPLLLGGNTCTTSISYPDTSGGAQADGGPCGAADTFFVVRRLLLAAWSIISCVTSPLRAANRSPKIKLLITTCSPREKVRWVLVSIAGLKPALLHPESSIWTGH